MATLHQAQALIRVMLASHDIGTDADNNPIEAENSPLVRAHLEGAVGVVPTNAYSRTIEGGAIIPTIGYILSCCQVILMEHERLVELRGRPKPSVVDESRMGVGAGPKPGAS